MEGINVPLLADKKPEEAKQELALAGELIRAAQENRLALIIGKHHETDKEGVIMCAMNPTDDGMAQYIPLGMLFTDDFQGWTEYNPPKCALEPSPLDNIKEEEETDVEEEDGSSETA